jgi:MoxR-like ATPase
MKQSKKKVMARYVFHGDPTYRPQHPHPDAYKQLEPYIPDEELKQAVNLAIYLRRPLLLEGEAGCGKTRLAAAIAYELGLPFYRWDVRSTSRAQEGLYKYDAILRLHDVQAQKVDSNLQRNPSIPRDYCEFGALGKAFQLMDYPAVVLIDEIDKADLDFPNDLLTVLDRKQEFVIPETQETIKPTPGNEPIIIITSNKEKGNLPAPFLRRCIYYFVKFPDHPDQLKRIVEIHYQSQEEQDVSPPETELIEAAAERFLALRSKGELFKNPSTSEFLDWLKALHGFGADPYPVVKLKSANPLPYRELLFKRRDDWQNFASALPAS